MPIKALTPQEGINAYLDKKVEGIRRALLTNLSYHGTQSVNEARLNGKYTDRTGNLRSSIGYAISVNSEPVDVSHFNVVKKGGDGANKGREFAMEVLVNFPQSVALVCVAGMEYAKCVSDRGLDVLDSAKLYLEREIPKLLKSFKKL